MAKIPDDVVAAAWSVFNELSLSREEAFEAAGDVFVKWERKQCADLCKVPVKRDAGYDGRWEGYGDFTSLMTGAECAAAIEERGLECVVLNVEDCGANE